MRREGGEAHKQGSHTFIRFRCVLWCVVSFSWVDSCFEALRHVVVGVRWRYTRRRCDLHIETEWKRVECISRGGKASMAGIHLGGVPGTSARLRLMQRALRLLNAERWHERCCVHRKRLGRLLIRWRRLALDSCYGVVSANRRNSSMSSAGARRRRRRHLPSHELVAQLYVRQRPGQLVQRCVLIQTVRVRQAAAAQRIGRVLELLAEARVAPTGLDVDHRWNGAQTAHRTGVRRSSLTKIRRQLEHAAAGNRRRHKSLAWVDGECVHD